MKELAKKIAREYLPYKYMLNRRVSQHIDILKEQEEPPVYNEKGERKRVFFLRDAMCRNTPYSLVYGQYPDKILWDRNNVGLPIQFYSHEYIWTENNKYAKKKYAFLFESEAIKNDEYARALLDTERMKEYNKIFTFSERILEKYDNALFIPASGLWYGTQINGGNIDETLCYKKEKNISVVSSKKAHSPGHRLRLQIANDAIKCQKADGYGAFCNNYIKTKADALTSYRYSIIVENDVNAYYFTEKIMDCFASMTVPIYIGATKISQFFNENGIIVLKENEYQNIEKVLDMCSKEDYENRLEAIKDNWERVKKYRCIEDYMMIHYAKEFEV